MSICQMVPAGVVPATGVVSDQSNCRAAGGRMTPAERSINSECPRPLPDPDMWSRLNRYFENMGFAGF